MTKNLSGSFYGPWNGKAPDALIVLFHGHGTDADDLLPLSYAWGSHMPNTLFWSINGPEIHPDAPMGRQWFPMHNIHKENLWEDMVSLSPLLKQSLECEMQNWSLTYSHVGLVGFSQGGIVALQQALYQLPVAASVSFSGRLVTHPDGRLPHKKPTLLIHGDADPVVPVKFLKEAQKTLKSAAVPFEAWVCEGVGHTISPFGIEKARIFLQRFLKH